MSMQTINVLAILVLRFLLSVAGQNEAPTKICSFAGADHQIIPNDLSPSEVPVLCGVVCYGFYYLDDGVKDTDIAAVDALVNDAKTVYQRVTYAGYPHWNDILNEMSDQDPGVPFTEIIGPLENHLTAHKISGVVLEKLFGFGLFDDCDTNKLSLFIKRLKTDVPDLKVCILLNASQCDSFGQPDLNGVNADVDLYIIDMTTKCRICNDDIAVNGRLSIEDIQYISDAVFNSSMDEAKLMMNFIDEVTVYDDIVYRMHGATYSDFCNAYENQSLENHNMANILWCSDHINTFIDHAQFARDKKYAGIMVSHLDYDDYFNFCECGLFPIANTYLNVFDGQTVEQCARIG